MRITPIKLEKARILTCHLLDYSGSHKNLLDAAWFDDIHHSVFNNRNIYKVSVQDLVYHQDLKQVQDLQRAKNDFKSEFPPYTFDVLAQNHTTLKYIVERYKWVIETRSMLR